MDAEEASKEWYALRPCPNCGDGNVDYRYSIAHGEPYQTRVACLACGVDGPLVRGMDEYAATEAWNAIERK